MYPTMTTAHTNDKETQFSDKFKATVALDALRADKAAQEIAAKHKVHPTQVTAWKRQATSGLSRLLSYKVRWAEENEAEVKDRGAKVDKLAVKNIFGHKG